MKNSHIRHPIYQSDQLETSCIKSRKVLHNIDIVGKKETKGLGFGNCLITLNSFKPGAPFMGHRQTV